MAGNAGKGGLIGASRCQGSSGDFNKLLRKFLLWSIA
jgi:hypothetical protein